MKYVGLTIEWDYSRHEVHISMLENVQCALTCFQHPSPRKPQHQPHPHVPQKYGQKQQFVEPEDSPLSFNKKKTKFVQEVTGTFLFYACAIDSTMLMALSAIASEPAKPTKNTLKKVMQFLDYAATNPKAIIMYQASSP